MSRVVLALLSLPFILPAAELPVRTVILYKHGVGYFERAGSLGAGESARLDFKASEMNDVLKSLTIEEKGGGKVAGVRYDSSEPLEKRLGEFPFRIGDHAPVSAFLDQLKGARLELRYGNETIAGAIVSARLMPAGGKQPEREQVTLLTDTNDLRNVDLSSASAFRLTDPALQIQLKDYLTALTGSRSRDKRSVYIDSSDARSREVAASYMIPMPVWKSSYRLIFPASGEPLLEGWAIVDNTTGEDWSNVQLSLVSGRPISFISRLYEPQYRQRPLGELAEDRNIGPVVHEGAMATAMAPSAPPPAPGARFENRAGRQILRSNVEVSADTAEKRADLPSTIAVGTEGRELGDLFEYRFSTPVNVRKNQSAMLPFLQQKIGARKLLIYSDRSTAHPMSAAELTNATGKTLDGGPITVYDANTYAGEALVETLKAAEKRLISYAVDLGTRITTNLDSTRDVVREVRFNRGVLTARSAVQETLTYTIRNVDAKAKTLIIEHPLRPNYKLLNQKPTETTANAYRFEVKLAPNATEKFAVSEEYLLDQTFMISSLTPDQLLTYARSRSISDAARKQLEAIAAKKREVAQADNAIRMAEQEIEQITKDQDRLRRNIASLNNVSGQQELVQRYARELAGQEAKMAALRDRAAEQRARKTALESELNSLIEKLEL